MNFFVITIFSSEEIRLADKSFYDNNFKSFEQQIGNFVLIIKRQQNRKVFKLQNQKLNMEEYIKKQYEKSLEEKEKLIKVARISNPLAVDAYLTPNGCFVSVSMNDAGELEERCFW